MPSTTKNTSLGELLFAFIICIVLMPIFALLQGWVVTILWAWFVVPTFKLAPLSIPAAMGMMLIYSYVTFGLRENKSKKDEEEEEKEPVWDRLLKVIGRQIGVTVAALVIGWIIKFFL